MRHLHNGSPRALRRRRLLLEALESRMLLDAEGLPWSAPDLTISFAPDGTNVAGHESSLFAAFDALATSSAWQEAVVRGFATWAQHTAATISTTPDSGDAFGTPGPTQGDARFGDVRVAAIPMANDVIAMSVPHDEVISGTWAGDILFNSMADLNSIDDIFAIAVHEAGHVFGLGHSTDPNSPMYLHGITPAVTPTNADINNLQRLYGVPEVAGSSDGGEDKDDEHEDAESEHDREHGDDDQANARGVMLSANFQGAIRYEVLGQILDAQDIDFYRLAPIDDEFEQADNLTVTIRATTPAGLIPSATILDNEGRSVESTVLANANGELIIQAHGADPRVPYFVAVSAAVTTGMHSIGTYELVATFSTREVVLDPIATGTLKPDQPTRTTVLHVTETRLIHFVLAVDPAAASISSMAWTAIYDGHGNPVFRAAARPGESRSANTLLLTPGDYVIEFQSEVPDGTDPAELGYRLLARSISLPIGPGPIDPTALPILPCSDPGSDPVYCYPDEPAIIDPFILPDPALILLPDPVVAITPPWLGPDSWYWDGILPPADIPAPIGTAPPVISAPAKSTRVPTPVVTPAPNILPPRTEGPAPTPVIPPAPSTPVGETQQPVPSSILGGWRNVALPHDVNADSQVSPLDALMIINFLNANGSQPLSSEHPSGSPFLDVNSDGAASPVDALLVINTLNRSRGVAAEGEAVPGAKGLVTGAPDTLYTIDNALPRSSTQRSVSNMVALIGAVNSTRSNLSASADTVIAVPERVSAISMKPRQSNLQTLEDAIRHSNMLCPLSHPLSHPVS